MLKKFETHSIATQSRFQRSIYARLTRTRCFDSQGRFQLQHGYARLTRTPIARQSMQVSASTYARLPRTQGNTRCSTVKTGFSFNICETTSYTCCSNSQDRFQLLHMRDYLVHPLFQQSRQVPASTYARQPRTPVVSIVKTGSSFNICKTTSYTRCFNSQERFQLQHMRNYLVYPLFQQSRQVPASTYARLPRTPVVSTLKTCFSFNICETTSTSY